MSGQRLVVCSSCGHKKPHKALGLCRGCYTHHRRQDPAIAAADRAGSLHWKQTHRDHTRAYGREYDAAHMLSCSRCGAAMFRSSSPSGLCLACRRQDAHEKRLAVVAMWADGLTMLQIAHVMGWGKNHLGSEMARMRALGYDLPHRYAVKDGKRVAA